MPVLEEVPIVFSCLGPSLALSVAFCGSPGFNCISSLIVVDTLILPVLNLAIISCNPHALAFCNVKLALILEGKSLNAKVGPNVKVTSVFIYISPAQKIGLKGLPIVMCQGVEGAPVSALAIPCISILYLPIAFFKTLSPNNNISSTIFFPETNSLVSATSFSVLLALSFFASSNSVLTCFIVASISFLTFFNPSLIIPTISSTINFGSLVHLLIVCSNLGVKP